MISKPIGLRNRYNNCFLNTALQILLNLSSVNETLLKAFKEEYYSAPPTYATIAARAVTSEEKEWSYLYLELFYNYHRYQAEEEETPGSPCNKSIGLEKFYRYLVDHERVNFGQQGDYHEFFLQLTDQLSKIQRTLKLQPTFDDLVTSTVSKEITCSECHRVSRSKDLLSSIPILVDDLATNLSMLENTTTIEGYQCDHCHRQVDAKMVSRVKKLAPLLFFQRLQKDGSSRINYQESYVITPSSGEEQDPKSRNSTRGGRSPNDLHYRLYALVIHSGIQSAGHYYLYLILDNQPSGTKTSYFINDEMVREESLPSNSSYLNRDLVSLVYRLD